MTSPKRHHYLPKFYVDRFAIDGSFHVFDRTTNQFRLQTPVNTAVEKDFYTVVDDSGNKNNAIESFISEIESKARPVIDNLDSGGDVSMQDRIDLSHFIALLIGRTPEFDATFKSFQEQMVRRVNKMIFNSIDQTQKVLLKYPESPVGTDLEAAKEVYEFVQKDKYDVAFGRLNTLQVMLDLTDSLAKYFAQMIWFVFHAPQDASFITTDSPFVIIPPPITSHNAFFRGVGIATPGARKLLPLSQRSVLVMSEKGDAFAHFTVPRKIVRESNHAIALHCFRFLIGRDLDLLKHVVSRTRINETKWTPRMKVG